MFMLQGGPGRLRNESKDPKAQGLGVSGQDVRERSERGGKRRREGAAGLLRVIAVEG